MNNTLTLLLSFLNLCLLISDGSGQILASGSDKKNGPGDDVAESANHEHDAEMLLSDRVGLETRRLLPFHERARHGFEEHSIIRHIEPGKKIHPGANVSCQFKKKKNFSSDF